MSQLQKYFRCIEDWRGDFVNVIRHFSLPTCYRHPGVECLVSARLLELRGRLRGLKIILNIIKHQNIGLSDKKGHISGSLKLFKVCWCWFSLPGLLPRGWSRCSSRPCPWPPGPHCWGCSGSCRGCRLPASRGQLRARPSPPHSPLLRCLAWCWWCNHSAPCSPACCCNENILYFT